VPVVFERRAITDGAPCRLEFQMYKVKTTFVVGAGASLELGFPTGYELKELIRKALDLRFDYSSRPTHGDRAVAEALGKHADVYDPKGHIEYNKHLAAGWHIRDAIGQAISIDNFVDNQQDDCVSRMAKLAIASCIIDAEKTSKLAQNVDGDREMLDWNNLEKTWLHFFFQTLTEGRKKSELAKLFENTDFVVFNYDRSLEHFLARAIENYYKTSREQAQNLVANCRFFHPYGQVGKLPWQKGTLPPVKYGSGEKYNLFEISKSILTFTEQIDDKESLDDLKKCICDANQLVFLGFAFHPSNMELIKPIRTRDTSRVIATAFGISDSDCDVIRKELKDICFVDNEAKYVKSGIFVIDGTVKCAEVFQNYRKTIVS
jgi:hypothetical protein